MEKKRILIAYFSRRGENYVTGGIRDLKEGNTEVVAKKIQAMIGGDLFEIKAVKPYPVGYDDTTEVAKAELRAKARPELTDRISDMDTYDTVILGFPNWWGTYPMPVATFLDSYDFSGKVLYPLCTHEGSGLGHSEKDLKQACPKADVRKGLAIVGSTVRNSDADLKRWLNELL